MQRDALAEAPIVNDLGYRTELMMIGFEGEVYHRGYYHVGRWPRAPRYFWGNLLVFDEPPGRWALHEWTETFRREFADLPQVRHMAFGWRAPGGRYGEVEAFEEVGFNRFRCEVLRARETRLPTRAADVTVRPARSDVDWEDVWALQTVVRPRTIPPETWAQYLDERVGGLRRLAEAGHGAVLGAFDDDGMQACLGIFARDGLARYQTVVTHPSRRCRGIAGRLVAEAGRFAREALGATDLVIIADEGAPAGRLYRAIGFEQVGWQVGMLRRPA